MEISRLWLVVVMGGSTFCSYNQTVVFPAVQGYDLI